MGIVDLSQKTIREARDIGTSNWTEQIAKAHRLRTKARELIRANTPKARWPEDVVDAMDLLATPDLLKLIQALDMRIRDLNTAVRRYGRR